MSPPARTTASGTTPLALDPERRAALRRSRTQATVLLVVVALAFLVVQAAPETTTWGYVEAALEAGLIGGLADWFAVVALFRHPLGVPIPHTAIIPTRKDQFGATIESFVRDQFLTTEAVRERIHDPALPGRLGAWLRERDNAERLAGGIAATAARVTAELDDTRVVDVAHELLVDQLDAVPAARLAGDGIDRFLADDRHHATVTAVVKGIRRAVEDNRDVLRSRLSKQAPRWVPQEVNEIVFDRGEEVVDTFLRQVAQDPDHELRGELDTRLAELAERLRTDDALAADVNGRLAAVARDDAVRAWVEQAWVSMRAAIRAATEDDDPLRARLTNALLGAGERLRDDPAAADQVTQWLASNAERIAGFGRDQVGTMIASTIEQWDGHQTADQLEGMLGRDLQFVRINGTLVGGLIGVVLHAITQAL